MAQINQMSIFKIAALSALPQFRYQKDQIAILEREPILGANAFFEKLLYREVNIKTLPEKVFKECVICPFFNECNEHALIKDI